MTIEIVVNTDEALAYAKKRLGEMEKKAPQAVRTALNKAAKEIKKSDEKTAKRIYNDPGDLNTLEMDKASTSSLEVILHDSGGSVSITHFKPRVGSRGVTATINKNRGSQLIRHKSGNKGFFPGTINGSRYGQRYRKKNVTAGYLRNGGATVVARTKASRLPIEKINSLSSPSAHGSPDVWNKVEPVGQKLLYKYLDEEIGRILSS